MIWFYSPDPDDTGSDSSNNNHSDDSSENSSDNSNDTSSSTDDTSSEVNDSSSFDNSNDFSSDSSSDTSDSSVNTSSSQEASNTENSGDNINNSDGLTGGGNQSSASADFDTDMQTIRDYVNAVVEVKTKIATAYLSAIDNFQTTVQSASPSEAKPNFLGTVLKWGLKAAEKQAISAVKDTTGADLGPLSDLVHAMYDEIEKASKAAENLAVSEWIKNVRTSITNAYTQDKTGEALRNQIENEYKNNSEGGRGGYIGGIQNELSAVSTVQASKEEIIEVAFYTAWISQNFNSDCMDGTGIIYLQFNDDGSIKSATVTAPLGDKIAGALNNQMAAAGISMLMNLDVDKKVCKGDSCMCFEGNNVIRKAASDDVAQTFLTSQDNWKKFNRFTL